VCVYICVVLKVESDTGRENKTQTTTSVVISTQMTSSKDGSDSHPRLSSKSTVKDLKSTSRRSAAPNRKKSTDSATVSLTALQQLNTDVTNNISPVRKSTAAGKKPTTRYKPAHHSAPFKTTPLPPGQSKFPSVSRPGSRKNFTPTLGVSRVVEARGTDRHGGKISVASSSASRTADMRRIVHNGSRTSVTSSATVASNNSWNLFDRNSPGNVASEFQVSDSENIALQGRDCDGTRTSNSASSVHGLRPNLISRGGNSNNSGISVANVTTRTQSNPRQTGSPDDIQTFDDASVVIGQQIGSASTDAMMASDVSRKTDTVQSATVVQPYIVRPNVNMSHTDETATDNLSSFVLHRDGQVETSSWINYFCIY